VYKCAEVLTRLDVLEVWQRASANDTNRAMRRVMWLVAIIGLAGCLYDSRWGDDKKLQQACAAQSRPTLSPEPATPIADDDAGAPPHSAKRTLRVRALVTRSFTVGVVEAPRHVKTVLADASDILESALGMRLELESIRPWDLARDDDLQAVLAESKKADQGADVDWIVGFVGALPRASRSFHDVGMGDVVGKHIIVRAPSSAEKHDAVESSYSELSNDERRAIQKGITRHRAAVTFLHEVGHTLGLVHERSARSIMFREYSARASSFGPESIAVMRVGLEHRAPQTPQEAAVLFRELGATMKRAPDGIFVEDERRQMVSRYEDAAAKNEASSTRPAQTAAEPQRPVLPETPELTPEHRAIFVKANEAAAAGDHVVAWTAMKPLFTAYPSSFAVQDLRCRLATQVLSFASARPECDRIMQLSK
jgi:hypothetical protein